MIAANPPPLSVLYVLPSPRFFSQAGGIGGHVAHACGVLEALARRGARLQVVAAEAPTAGRAPGQWTVLPCADPAPLPRYLWGRRLVAAVGRAAAPAAPTFCYLRYGAQFAPLVPALRAALGPVPLVIELNSFAAQGVGTAARLWAPLERRALRSATLVLCVSDLLRDRAAALVGPAAADRLVVVPNGVDPARFATPVAPAADAPPRLCYCGVLKDGYGLSGLLAAHAALVPRYPGLELHIIGDGPHLAALERAPDRAAGVVFHGPVPFDRVPELLGGMTVLVYTTTPANTFQSPIKLYEYMCTGRPIVAADTPQTRGVLGGEPPCGTFFAAADTAELTAAVARVLDDLPAAEARADLARAAVVRDHTWDQRVADLLAALAGRGVRP